MSFAIHVDFSDIDQNLLPLLSGLAEFDQAELMDGLGAIGASQTQRRISSEKTSPEGVPWQPNRRGSSILVLEGHLLTSIAHEADGTKTQWGSNLVYAAIHQTGGVIKAKNTNRLKFKAGGKWFSPTQVTIPKRPYLGLSETNKKEIAQALVDYVEGLLQ